jgi:hypothetical protein
MAHPNEKRRVTIVTACMTAAGSPTFVLNEVEVTQEDYENGVHYYLAEADLLVAGYEEPYVHFDDREAPPFLIPAVKQHLGLDKPDVSLCPAR